MARVAPGSLEGAARPASGAKSRPRRSPERPEEAIWLDFGSILGGFWPDNRARNGCVEKLCARRVSKAILVTVSSFFSLLLAKSLSREHRWDTGIYRTKRVSAMFVAALVDASAAPKSSRKRTSFLVEKTRKKHPENGL